ncbi:hypothetical protein MUK42_06555 [Musa troglodytarum]|uniref:Uncharacterized protein n=1 Tax=Musa troglodytarum TaxID=320322 RepID=A0A9E7HC68_9LILI|nr:hypothetical protein MUK42_06555 [Musa troglodytarum]
MELLSDDAAAEGEEEGREPSGEPLVREPRHCRVHFPGAVRQKAYLFDGLGNYYNKEWDLKEGSGKEFCWYHAELPKGNQKLALSAQYLIDVLCPPLKLQDILTLVSNGPFCGHVDGALVFRVNSPGPAASSFTLRLAARVTQNSVITVSLGRIPRLDFSPTGQSLLSEIPSIESTGLVRDAEEEEGGRSGIIIREHVLEFLLTMNHSEEADNPVPVKVSNLVVHIIDTHVDHVQDIVTKLEMELDAVELELDKGGSTLKKQMLDDRRFPKLHLNLQRLLQVVAHGEQVFPRVKEKCSAKSWFANEDIIALEELIGRLRRLKDNLGFIVNRVTAIQAGLHSWQSEQINKKLYYLSFLSLTFLPLSIVTGIFGMNVGGVPWTAQKDPALQDGFRNVMANVFASLEHDSLAQTMVLTIIDLLCPVEEEANEAAQEEAQKDEAEIQVAGPKLVSPPLLMVWDLRSFSQQWRVVVVGILFKRPSSLVNRRFVLRSSVVSSLLLALALVFLNPNLNSHSFDRLPAASFPMASSSSSGSDQDEAFDADMEALRRACMLTGADPSNVGGAGSDSESESGPESSGSDDAGLLCHLQERFSSPSRALNSFPFNKPSSTLSQESDCEDDFETLRAVQKRFKQYESDSLRKKPEKLLEEPEIAVGIVVCGPETPNRSTELSKEHGYSYNESHTLEHEEFNSIVGDLMPPKFPKSAQNFVDALKKNSDVEGITDSSIMSAITLSDLEFTPEKIRSFMPLVNWNRLASMYVMGHSGTECEARWRKTLNPERKKVGRWSVDEDKHLKVAVMLFGAKNWNKIARFAPGRTQVQCRERWLNCLDPALNLNPWTAEEDAKLLDAIAVLGKCWSKIAACIPPRTDNQCRRRWKILLPEEVKLLQAAAQIKKTALISNFVDRESERPAIGPNDFTSIVNSTISEKTDDVEARKNKLSDNQPKKSKAKSRRVIKENSMEDQDINNFTDTVPADLAHLRSTESNSTERLGICRSGNKRSRSSDKRPRKSRVKSISHLKENSTKDCMINTSSDIAPADMSLSTAVNSTSTEGVRIGRTTDITLSENQQSTDKHLVLDTSADNSATESIGCRSKRAKSTNN